MLEDLEIYDVFLVYEESCDYAWVETELIPKISDEWGFNFCVSRMLDSGSQFENCEIAIASSRKIILVITPAYAADSWCQFQMEMILTAIRKRIIVIYKEDVPARNMSRTLFALLQSGHVKYGQDPVALELFWKTLHDKLKK